jgi:UDP-N-acetyl-D-galactosamine dehydrogenase
MMGYHSQVILAGRRINDSMATYVAQQTVKKIIQSGGSVKGSKVIILGLTFKENCADIRNSKVADLIKELKEFGCEISVHDPLADPKDAKGEYGITLTNWNDLPIDADAIVAAVSHTEYSCQPVTQLLAKLKQGGAFIDIKSAYQKDVIENAGYTLWRL